MFNNLKLSFISGDLSRCFFWNAMKLTAPIVTASFGSRLSARQLCYNVIKVVICGKYINLNKITEI